MTAPLPSQRILVLLTADRLPDELLHALARELFVAGLSVRSARIGTHLDQVVDAFHVTDADGSKPTDPVRLDALRRALEAAALPVTGPA